MFYICFLLYIGWLQLICFYSGKIMDLSSFALYDLWICFLVVFTELIKVTGHWQCDICFGVSHVKWCTVILFMNILIKNKKKVNDVLWFIARKHFVIEFKFSAHYSTSHFTQMRNCHSRTSSALGGLLGRLLPFHWQPLSFHLWDEALLGLDLLWTDSLLKGDEGLDVLEQDIDLCSLLLQIPLKHVRPRQH